MTECLARGRQACVLLLAGWLRNPKLRFRRGRKAGWQRLELLRDVSELNKTFLFHRALLSDDPPQCTVLRLESTPATTLFHCGMLLKNRKARLHPVHGCVYQHNHTIVLHVVADCHVTKASGKGVLLVSFHNLLVVLPAQLFGLAWAKRVETSFIVSLVNGNEERLVNILGIFFWQLEECP